MDRDDSTRGPLRVGLCGLGTVGAAVAAQLLDPGWRAGVASRGLVPPELVAVGVRDPDRTRGVELPASVRRTAALLDLAVAPDIDVLVELIGGTGDAADVVRCALDSGTPVVTGNKALLARSGAQLEAAARASGAALRFEAAVAGGVPALGPLVLDLAANRIDGVRGILNGTTNYILSAMADGGRAYGDALEEAQARGYAEPDPSGDVDGQDAANKLAVLIRLAFGGWPDVATLRRAAPAMSGDALPGITGVEPLEIAGAADLGLAIKLVARAGRADDGTIRAAVSPMAVRATSPLGWTDGVNNLVEVMGCPVGHVAFRGRGAGGDASASAVLGDVLALGRGAGSAWGPLPAAPAIGVRDDLEGEHAWFFVLTGLAGGHVPARITEIALAVSREAFVTLPMTLDAVRERLHAAGTSVTIYPVLAEA